MRASAARATTVAAALGLLALLGLSQLARGQGAVIITCDLNGKRITSDRPIPACSDREQRELNSDGSLRRIIPPTQTPDERAAAEAAEQQAALARANQREAMRRDRNLLQRFPNEPVHKKAREAAVDDTRKALKNSEARLELLEKERKPLMDESEFYVGKPLPLKLKQQIEGNDAATDAQRSLVLNQQAELIRINNLYDLELERLRKLWSGAQPGSMGTLPTPLPSPASAPRKSVAM